MKSKRPGYKGASEYTATTPKLKYIPIQNRVMGSPTPNSDNEIVDSENVCANIDPSNHSPGIQSTESLHNCDNDVTSLSRQPLTSTCRSKITPRLFEVVNTSPSCHGSVLNFCDFVDELPEIQASSPLLLSSTTSDIPCYVPEKSVEPPAVQNSVHKSEIKSREKRKTITPRFTTGKKRKSHDKTTATITENTTSKVQSVCDSDDNKTETEIDDSCQNSVALAQESPGNKLQLSPQEASSSKCSQIIPAPHETVDSCQNSVVLMQESISKKETTQEKKSAKRKKRKRITPRFNDKKKTGKTTACDSVNVTPVRSKLSKTNLIPQEASSSISSDIMVPPCETIDTSQSSKSVSKKKPATRKKRKRITPRFNDKKKTGKTTACDSVNVTPTVQSKLSETNLIPQEASSSISSDIMVPPHETIDTSQSLKSVSKKKPATRKKRKRITPRFNTRKPTKSTLLDAASKKPAETNSSTDDDCVDKTQQTEGNLYAEQDEQDGRLNCDRDDDVCAQTNQPLPTTRKKSWTDKVTFDLWHPRHIIRNYKMFNELDVCLSVYTNTITKAIEQEKDNEIRKALITHKQLTRKRIMRAILEGCVVDRLNDREALEQ